MDKSTLESWYRDKGCNQINKLLVSLRGKRIGQIPLINLLPQNFDEDDIEHCSDLLVDDGCVIDKVTYKDGSVEYFVFLN